MNTITQLADAHPFNKDYTVEIPATGRPVRVDAAGLFFMASDSTTAFPFDMSFDGQSWFRWNVGLALPWPTGFKSVWFRSIDGVAVSLIFYAGNLPPADSRLTIVRDPNHYQLFNFQVAPTLTKAFNTASIAGGGASISSNKDMGWPPAHPIDPRLLATGRTFFVTKCYPLMRVSITCASNGLGNGNPTMDCRSLFRQGHKSRARSPIPQNVAIGKPGFLANNTRAASAKRF